MLYPNNNYKSIEISMEERALKCLNKFEEKLDQDLKFQLEPKCDKISSKQTNISALGANDPSSLPDETRTKKRLKFALYMASLINHLKYNDVNQHQHEERCDQNELFAYICQMFTVEPENLLELLESNKVILSRNHSGWPQNNQSINDYKLITPELNKNHHSKQPPTKVILKLSNVTKHLRIYCYCIIFQLLDLKRTSKHLDEPQGSSHLELENLFYLPGLTLIKQHCLLINLNTPQDLCLRRIALLILIIRFNELTSISKEFVSKLEQINMQQILLFILQNEYQKLSRNNKMLNQIWSSRLESTTLKNQAGATDQNTVLFNPWHPITEYMELISLRRFLDIHLINNLRRTLCLRPVVDNDVNEQAKIERISTLYSLRMVKLAGKTIEESQEVMKMSQQNENLSSNKFKISTYIYEPIERTICEQLLEHLNTRINRNLMFYNNLSRNKSTSAEVNWDNSWSKLYLDLRFINQDISIHWSEWGFEGCIMKQRNHIRNLDPQFSTSFDKQGLKNMIKSRLERFIHQ